MNEAPALAPEVVPATAQPDLTARLDALPVTPLHRAIVIICALGLLFDVVEAAPSTPEIELVMSIVLDI